MLIFCCIHIYIYRDIEIGPTLGPSGAPGFGSPMSSSSPELELDELEPEGLDELASFAPSMAGTAGGPGVLS